MRSRLLSMIRELSALGDHPSLSGVRGLLQRLRTPSESKLLTVLALIVGVAAGFSAFLFMKLITEVQLWIAWLGHWDLSLMNQALLVVAPGLGGFAGGWLINRYASTHRSTGTAQVIFALRRHHGVIPAKVSLAKTLASALTIGTGGSAGPEGPAVQIGSGLGSVIGRWCRLPPDHLRTLVAAGAASGIAAVFNAPIAGVMYALEVLLRQLVSQAFAVVVLSTVTASLVSYLLVGHHIFMKAPAFATSHPAEWGAYAVLGILAAAMARAFTAMFLATEKRFDGLKEYGLAQRAMLGGFAVGLLGFFHPQVMGPGHEIVRDLLQGETVVPMAGLVLAGLLLAKMLATSCSLASGGSGGLFVPTLSMGALLGVVFGKALHHVLPQAAPNSSYVLLGMGALFAGFTYAPFTSVMLLFEMTNDYSIVLPAMFTIGVTAIVSRALDPDSLDAHELKHKGLQLHEDAVLSALEYVTAAEVMSTPVDMIPETATLQEISQWMTKTSHSGVPVMNEKRQLVGLITYSELHHACDKNSLAADKMLAKEIMRSTFPTLTPGDSLTEAVRRMQNDSLDRILVLLPDESRQAVGIITKSDILKIYSKALR